MRPVEEFALARLRQRVASTLTCLQFDKETGRKDELGSWLDEFTPALASNRAKEIAALLSDRAKAWSQAAVPAALPREARRLLRAADDFLAIL